MFCLHNKIIDNPYSFTIRFLSCLNIDNTIVKCACGCGQDKLLKDKKGRKHRYIKNHFKVSIFTFRDKRGSKSHMWKGGRYMANGYIMIYAPDHPNSGPYKGAMFEHIIVMEKHIGRYINSQKERVYHKNGIKDDNRLENLELVSVGEFYRRNGLKKGGKKHEPDEKNEKIQKQYVNLKKVQENSILKHNLEASNRPINEIL